MNQTAEDLFLKKIRNIIIFYNSNLNSLDFKTYFFNGIPVPKNIKTEEKGNKLFISWEIDDFRIKDFDNKEIRYIININANNKTSSIEASETFIMLEEYNFDVDYNIKIKAIIDGSFGDWSEVLTFKMEKHNNIFGGYKFGSPFAGNFNQGVGLFGRGFEDNDKEIKGLFGN